MHALHATCGISVFLEGMGAAMVSGALACGWAVVLHLACGGAAMVDAGLQSKMLSTVCAKQTGAQVRHVWDVLLQHADRKGGQGFILQGSVARMCDVAAYAGLDCSRNQ